MKDTDPSYEESFVQQTSLKSYKKDPIDPKFIFK